jgi:hypothetical protein
MASGFIGNEVPRKGLRVRAPCPPLCRLIMASESHGLWLSIEIASIDDSCRCPNQHSACLIRHPHLDAKRI